MVKVYSLYLSTQSPAGTPYAPIVDNQSVVAWNINWDSFFGSQSANNSLPNKCRVKFLLTSKSGTLVYNNTMGSLRANFTSSYANNYNGVNLGLITPVNDPTTTTHRYLGDTTSSIGIDINLPRGNQDFQLRFVASDESILSVALDYQVWLYFEVEEHN
jgi:hypothetical protein